MSDKIYVGTGKIKEFSDGGSILKFSFTEKDLGTLREHLSNGWVNIAISKRKTPSEKGTTHYAVIDTWKPKSKSDPAEALAGEHHPSGQGDVDVMPF